MIGHCVVVGCDGFDENEACPFGYGMTCGFLTLEDEAMTERIEREVREKPISTALTESRARSLYEKAIERMREHGSEISIDKIMEDRRASLDDAARRMEHEA